MMPDLDGFGLLAALRADPARRSCPVIMLSARAGEEATVEGLAAGADDYLVKPFSPRELLARVRANLELAELRQAAARARSSAGCGAWPTRPRVNAPATVPEVLEVAAGHAQAIVGRRAGAPGALDARRRAGGAAPGCTRRVPLPAPAAPARRAAARRRVGHGGSRPRPC